MMKRILAAGSILVLLLAPNISAAGSPPGRPPAGDHARPLNVLVLLGEWFGDAYFPLAREIETRGWAMKRVGVEAKYRGCYNKSREIVLKSDILIPDLKDFNGYDALIIPSGPQWRKFNENQTVLDFVRNAHTAGLIVASFCVGNTTVKAAGLVDLPNGPQLYPDKVTLVKERVLIGPRGGGPPPGDGFESAPIKEICDAVARELDGKTAAEPPGQDVFDLLRKGDVEAVKAMVKKSPRLVEARDSQGMTLLHYAAYGRSPDDVDFLIGLGAKAEAKDTQGHTPLHIAAMNDGAEVAGALLKHGAVLEARDDYGRTALVLCARERGGIATTRVLIEAGADVNSMDKFGSGALELAAWRGKKEVVDYLLDKGAKLPEPGEKWHGLLSLAASQGLETLFRRLAGQVQDLKSAADAGPRKGVRALRARPFRLDAASLRGPRRPDRRGPRSRRKRRPSRCTHDHGSNGL
jgi:ankyrin repeat protein